MKKLIAISGKMGLMKLPTGKTNCNMIEWVGEYDNGWCIHFACRWKETSKAIYFKWLY